MAAEELLPAWAYDLITAAEGYEDAHGNAHEGWLCLNDQLQAVPKAYREQARAIAVYLKACIRDPRTAEPHVWQHLVQEPPGWQQMPAWFYDLLAAVDGFESAHKDPIAEGETCFESVLRSVPGVHFTTYRAIAHYLSDKKASQ